MNKFHKQITVSVDDLDDLNHVNNVRYVQWIQDISKEHWQTKAPTKIQNEYIWFVLSHYITYEAAAFLDDVIDISTYIEKSAGAKCTRIVEMHNHKTNKLIVRSSTEWCLGKATTQRPTRISNEIRDIFL